MKSTKAKKPPPYDKLKVRITSINVSEEQMVQTLLSLTNTPDTAIVVQEKGKKTAHYHAYLENFNRGTEDMRKAVRDITQTGGNKGYSFGTKHHNWDGYKAYLFKEDEVRILHNLYDPEEMKRYYIKVSNPHSKKSCEYNDIYKFVMEKLGSTPPKPRLITRYICDYYLEHSKIFHKAHQSQILRTIWYSLGNDRETLITSILQEAELEMEDSYWLDRPPPQQTQELQAENQRLKRQMKMYQFLNDPEYKSE